MRNWKALKLKCWQKIASLFFQNPRQLDKAFTNVAQKKKKPNRAELGLVWPVRDTHTHTHSGTDTFSWSICGCRPSQGSLKQKQGWFHLRALIFINSGFQIEIKTRWWHNNGVNHSLAVSHTRACTHAHWNERLGQQRLSTTEDVKVNCVLNFHAGSYFYDLFRPFTTWSLCGFLIECTCALYCRLRRGKCPHQ